MILKEQGRTRKIHETQGHGVQGCVEDIHVHLHSCRALSCHNEYKKLIHSSVEQQHRAKDSLECELQAYFVDPEMEPELIWPA
jgi:hypothetical protein